MAHEIEIVDGQARMFSAREMPWHGLGTVTEGALTAADAIKTAGLDWEVEKQPVYVGTPRIDENGVGRDFKAIPNRFALVRDNDSKVLGVVSDVYKPFQNREAFSFMDTLVDDGSAKYETAMSLKGGKVVALTMKVPGDILIGGEDKHEQYILLRTSHDGSGRIGIHIVVTRVVCQNTLTMAIRGARHSWGITHTADIAGKISNARSALGMTFAYGEAFKAEAEKLLSVTVTDDDIVKLLEGEMRDLPRRDKEIDSIIVNYHNSPNVANYVGTAWGFLQGYTEFEEHGKANRSQEALFSRTIDGFDAKMRTTLKDKLLTLA